MSDGTNIGDNKYFGAFPIRQDVTVLGNDDKKLNLKWSVEWVPGGDVFKGSWPFRHTVKKLRGLKEGSRVMLMDFLDEPDYATITSIDYDKKEALAENEYSWYPLRFNDDKRHIWAATSQFNQCIPKILEISGQVMKKEKEDGQEKRQK